MREQSHPGGKAPSTAGTIPQRVILVAGAGIALALAFALWYRPHTPPPSPPAPLTTLPGPTLATTRIAYLTVHVTGAVSQPGLVAVPDGSRVADALAAAGGVRPGAEMVNVNLAALVADGMHIVVPWVGDLLPAGPRDTADRTSDFPVNVNTAGVDRLIDLPGVGQVLATRILTYREAHGPFETLEDLLDVPGIGEGKLAGLRDHAVVRR